MTRYLPVDGYGDVVLGITFLQILGTFAILGLGKALARYIPRDRSDTDEVIRAIFQMGIAFSLVWAVVGVLIADEVSSVWFDNPALTPVFQIFALSVPVFVVFKLSLKGIQGHQTTRETVLTNNLLLPISRLLFVGLFALAGYGVVGIAIGFNIGFLVGASVGTYFLYRLSSVDLRRVLIPVGVSQYRELLRFSIPLALSASVLLVTLQADVVIIGWLKGSEPVGVYDIVYLMSRSALFFVVPINYLLQPKLSELDSVNEHDVLRDVYRVLTRWLVVLSYPILVLFVLSPGPILGTMFGAEYATGSPAFLLLSTAFFGSLLVGFTGSYLTAVGETRVKFYISLVLAAVNISLDLLLIPQYGIFGAALATGTAVLVSNYLEAIYMGIRHGIHPFDRKYAVPTVVALCALVATKALVETGDLPLAYGFTGAAILGLGYVLVILGTRSVYRRELTLLEALLSRAGWDVDLQRHLGYLVR